MANSTPIYSSDLYQPGQEDTLRKLIVQLQAIQNEIREVNAAARGMRDSLKILNSANSPQKVVAAATEAQRIHNEKQRLAVKQQLALDKMRQVSAAQTAAIVKRSEQQQQRELEKTKQAMLRSQIAANNLEKSKIQLANASKRTGSSFTGLLGSLRNLTYAYFSLSAAQQIVGKLFGETKALNTLDAAFKQTLGSIQDVTAAKEFLIDITTRYGADLLTASNAYLKFGTAAKQAGVSAKVTNDIFESFTKASSVLGLGAERTSYVFLALEQIMSKGRLSTEELRRQLGEHLPGAFGIAAQAMGVTTAKLTDMLKKGEIASTDFLPKFAKQIEIAYGIANVKKVDNLAAAQGRFNNEITLLIRDLDVASAFKGFFNVLASGVKFIRTNISAFSALANAIFRVAVAWAAVKIFGIISSIGSLRKAVIALTVAMEANPFFLLAGAIALLLPKIQQLIRHMNGVSDAAYDMRDSIDAMNASFADEYQSVTKSLKVFSDVNSTLNERQQAYDTLNEKYPEILKNYDLEKRRVEDLTKAQNDLRTAIIDRIAGEALDESNKQLFKDLQSANTFTPGFFSLYNKNNNGLGVSQEDIANARKAEADIALAEAKQRAEVIRQTAEQMKTIRSEELDQLTKIDELEGRASGRSFGQIDQQMQLNEAIKNEAAIREILDKFNKKELEAVIASKDGSVLRHKIAAELLGDKFPTNGGGDETGNGKGKDPRIAEIDRLIELNKLREDGLQTRLDAVSLANQKERILHEKDREYLIALEENYIRELSRVGEDYYSDVADKVAKEREQQKDAFTKRIQDAADAAKAERELKEKIRKDSVDYLRNEFDQRRDHEKAIFDLTEHTSEESNRKALKLKADELNDEIQLHRIFGKVLSDEELARAIELRDKIREQLGKDGKGIRGAKKKGKGDETDIFSLLNINFKSDEQKQVVIDALDFAKSQLTDFLDFQKEIIDQQIEDADRLVRSKEENLNRQIALAAANQANNVAGAQAELALAKKTQEDALKQRQKFQKTELALNTALEASNLGVAIAKTLAAGLGLAGIGLVALMLGAFAAAKIKAFQLVNKKTFRKGGFEEIKGGSHESGNDTHVGGNNWAERDESVGIFNAKATRKYKPTLKAFVNAANKGVLEQILIQDRRAIQGMNFNQNIKVDTSVMEKRLGTLVSLSQRQSFVDGQGRLNIIDRGRKTIVK